MSNVFLDEISLDKGSHKAMPLYQQIYRQLLEMIETGVLNPGDKLPATAYLAKTWQVTYRTVKAAYDLLIQDGAITVLTNKHVVVADRATAAAMQEKALSVAFVTCHHDDPYYALVAMGIRRFAVENHWEYVMVDVGASKQRFIDAVSSPCDDFNGMLLLPFEIAGYAEAVEQAMACGKSVVFVDRVLPGVKASSVEVDHFSVAFQATNHLLTEHNRPVYYLAFVDNPSGARDWYRGWAAAMQTHNVTALQDYTCDLAIPEVRLADTLDVGLKYCIDAARHLFDTHAEEVYCIFAGNDFIARGVYIAAQERGLQIGRDVFVVGSNDMPLAEKLEVPLTSVRTVPQPEALGYQAARVLYQHMTGKINNPVRRLLPVELVVRASSLPRS